MTAGSLARQFASFFGDAGKLPISIRSDAGQYKLQVCGVGRRARHLIADWHGRDKDQIKGLSPGELATLNALSVGEHPVDTP